MACAEGRPTADLLDALEWGEEEQAAVDDVSVSSGGEEEAASLPAQRGGDDDDDEDEEEVVQEEAAAPAVCEEEQRGPAPAEAEGEDLWRPAEREGCGVMEVPARPGAKEPATFWLKRQDYERLYPYQRRGVAWMARLWQHHQGGILADEMGLGKTIQVCGLLNGARKAGATHALLLLPVTLIEQWAREARLWCPGWPIHVYYGNPAQRAKALRRIRRPEGGLLLTSYSLIGNVEELLEVAVDDAPSPRQRGGRQGRAFLERRPGPGAAKRRRLDDDEAEEHEDSDGPPQEVEAPAGPLPRTGESRAWDIVICDEAHKMKNISTYLGKTLRRLRSKCRLLLTGTPVQNALQDMWALMDFAQPGLLGNHATFVKTFSEPIDRGSVRGAKVWAVELKKHLSEQLRTLIAPHILRRTKVGAGLLPDEPMGRAGGAGAESQGEGAEDGEGDETQVKQLLPKKEVIVWLAPSEEQVAAYKRVLEQSEVIREACKKQKLGIEVFRAIGLLKRLCNHPALLLPTPKPGQWANFLAEASNPRPAAPAAPGPAAAAEPNLAEPAARGPPPSDAEGADDGPSPMEVDEEPATAPGAEEAAAATPVGKARPGDAPVQDEGLAVVASDVTEETLGVGDGFAASGGGAVDKDDARSGRAVEMMLRKLSRSAESLRQQSAKLRCLFVLLPALASRGHRTLIFSHSVKMLDLVQVCCLKPHGLRCLRIDGQTDPLSRSEKVAKFQREQSRFHCMLLTTSVGGVGLNLTSADRVILVDPAWNPATDAQAVDRAFRIGQEKEVRVYRLIMSGLIEDKMFRLQVFKMGLTKTALEADQKHNYFTSREIRALFEWTDPKEGETRRLLQDRHGLDAEVAVGEAANEDGAAADGWLQAGPAVGLSDFAALYSGVADDESEQRDEGCAGQVAEAKLKLSAADHKLQRALEARQEAEALRDRITRELEEAGVEYEQAREKRVVAEGLLRDRRAASATARRVEAAAQARLGKADKSKGWAQEALERAVQGCRSGADAAGQAALAAADAAAAAVAAEDGLQRALAEAEAQLAGVGGKGTTTATVEASAGDVRNVRRVLDKARQAVETMALRQGELDAMEEEWYKAEQATAVAAASAARAGCKTAGSDAMDDAPAGTLDAKVAIARKGAELTLKNREKERQRVEQAVLRAVARAETARDSAVGAIQALQEAGAAFADALQRPQGRPVRADQFKVAQAAVKSAFRGCSSHCALTKRARETWTRAAANKRKAAQKATAALIAEAEAEQAAAVAEREHAESAAEEAVRRAEREARDAEVATAEAEQQEAEQEEADAKRKRDDLKAQLPGAKDAVKTARGAEKEALGERQALHANCEKMEREHSKVEEAKNTAIHTLKGEAYNARQVEQAYEQSRKAAE